MTVLTDPTGNTVNVPAAVVPDYLQQGYTQPGLGAAPESGPDDTWTVKQLDAYATEHGIDLDGAARKSEKLQRIRVHHDD